MHKHWCQFDWEDRHIHLTFGTQRIKVQAATRCLLSLPNYPEKIWLFQATPTFMPKQRPVTSKTNKGANTQHQFKTRTFSQKRWLPKNLLKAQHFYDGNPHIWVPKAYDASDKKQSFKHGQKQEQILPSLAYPKQVQSAI